MTETVGVGWEMLRESDTAESMLPDRNVAGIFGGELWLPMFAVRQGSPGLTGFTILHL